MKDNLKNSSYLFGYLFLIYCLLIPNVTIAQNEIKKTQEIHHNSAFIGGGIAYLTGDHSQIAPVLELGYERAFNKHWGLIGIFELEFEKSHIVYVLGAGPSFHLGSKSYVYAGPALEIGDHSTKLTFNAMYKYKLIEFEKSYIKLGSYLSFRRQLSVASIGLVLNWALPF